jgi:hypothetical protein
MALEFGELDPRSRDRQIGRQGLPTMAELAADVGTTRARGGEQVEHHCPECGSAMAGVAWRPCGVCGGSGLLSEDQMSAYLSVQNKRSL